MIRVKDEVFDPLKALDEQGEHPLSWKPEPGDVLTGVIRRYSMVTLEYGDTYICVVQDAPDRVQSVFLSGAVLKGEFSRMKPKVGERVVIRYLGVPAGKKYHKFSLTMPDRPDIGVTPDWDQMDPDQRSYGASVPDDRPGAPYAAATISGGKGGVAVAAKPGVQPVIDLEDDEDPFRDA